MVRLRIKYFLNTKGLECFEKWYQEVFNEVSKQDGFRDMKYEKDSENYIVYLEFENQLKLNLWTEKPIHDELFSKIETYFYKDLKVNKEYSYEYKK